MSLYMNLKRFNVFCAALALCICSALAADPPMGSEKAVALCCIESGSQIFARRGLSMDLGGSWLLPRLVGLHRAKELALLADWISAEEAERIGVVNRVVPAAELDAFVTDWAEQLAAGPPVALALTKQMLDGASTRSFEEALDLECTSQAVNLATEDTREAFKAFFEKRTPTFEGR